MNCDCAGVVRGKPLGSLLIVVLVDTGIDCLSDVIDETAETTSHHVPRRSILFIEVGVEGKHLQNSIELRAETVVETGVLH